jgi:hypothetical protein
MKGIKVHFGTGGIEKVHPFTYRGKTWYGELHCFCGWLVSDENRMGVSFEHPAFKYFIKTYDYE